MFDKLRNGVASPCEDLEDSDQYPAKRNCEHEQIESL